MGRGCIGFLEAGNSAWKGRGLPGLRTFPLQFRGSGSWCQRAGGALPEPLDARRVPAGASGCPACPFWSPGSRSLRLRTSEVAQALEQYLAWQPLGPRDLLDPLKKPFRPVSWTCKGPTQVEGSSLSVATASGVAKPPLEFSSGLVFPCASVRQLAFKGRKRTRAKAK